jgi:hypothetical protein
LNSGSKGTAVPRDNFKGKIGPLRKRYSKLNPGK